MITPTQKHYLRLAKDIFFFNLAKQYFGFKSDRQVKSDHLEIVVLLYHRHYYSYGPPLMDSHEVFNVLMDDDLVYDGFSPLVPAFTVGDGPVVYLRMKRPVPYRNPWCLQGAIWLDSEEGHKIFTWETALIGFEEGYNNGKFMLIRDLWAVEKETINVALPIFKEKMRRRYGI